MCRSPPVTIRHVKQIARQENKKGKNQALVTKAKTITALLQRNECVQVGIFGITCFKVVVKVQKSGNHSFLVDPYY